MAHSIHLDYAPVARRISRMMSPAVMTAMNRQVGVEVTERLKDFLATMSVSHHKTADRLGARPTGYFENAPGRTVLKSADASGSTVVVKNTPGLERAWHDMHISARRAKALTIPLSRVSYGKSVRDLRNRGHVVFRLKGKNVLVESTGKKEKVRPLYALVKSVHIPRDRTLMPDSSVVTRWAKDAVENFVASAETLGADLLELTSRADSAT